LTLKADVVLPVTIWSEQAGHYINMDGRIQKAEKVIEAPQDVRENLAVLAELARCLDIPVSRDWKESLQEHKSSVVLS
jgi:NADH dehydrogenase/NADH:ubiquinone oxidoreductase subunit G